MLACSATAVACPLTLLNVNRWHYGTYECVATNVAGTISRFYEVDVQCESSTVIGETFVDLR